MHKSKGILESPRCNENEGRHPPAQVESPLRRWSFSVCNGTPKDDELCLGRAKPEESGPNVQIGHSTWLWGKRLIEPFSNCQSLTLTLTLSQFRTSGYWLFSGFANLPS